MCKKPQPNGVQETCAVVSTLVYQRTVHREIPEMGTFHPWDGIAPLACAGVAGASQSERSRELIQTHDTEKGTGLPDPVRERGGRLLAACCLNAAARF